MKQIQSDDVPSTSASMKLRLKCNPSKLPEPPLEKPKVKKLSEMPKETMLTLLDFYRQQKVKRQTTWLKNNKRNRRTQ